MKTNIISEYQDTDIAFNHIRYNNFDWDGIEPQTHNIFEIIYLIEGNLTYTIEGKSYQVQPNSIIFTRPGYSHTIDFNNSNIYERYDIIFDDKKLFNNIYDILSDDTHIVKLGNQTEIVNLFKKSDYYYKHFNGKTFSNLLFNLIDEILCNIQIANISVIHEHTGNNILTQAIDYISRHITEQFSLDELCSNLFITKSYLHKLFIKNLHTTPKKFIISKRLILAQNAIRNNEKPSLIYNKYGFSDYSSFYRNYIKFFGYSPSDEGEAKIMREIKI